MQQLRMEVTRLSLEVSLSVPCLPQVTFYELSPEASTGDPSDVTAAGWLTQSTPTP